MNEISCSNCQTKILSAYCPQCGQKYIQKRVSFYTIFTDFGGQIFSLEKSVFATVFNLIISPKKIIENYWNGYRNYDQSPGRLLFYFLTIAGLHLLFVDENIFQINVKTPSSLLSPQMAIIILVIPILSLTTFISFRNQKRNYGEHFIAHTYLFSVFGSIVIILDDLLTLISNELETYPLIILLLAILFWTSLLFSKKRSWHIYLLNFFIEVVVLLAILSCFVVLGYFTGGGIVIK
ncbi:MAG: hypothetical protein CVT95_03980 [Bacteroidetes bacterium HGW-Bacteroidetes-12]|nr:MAG: hypothetical protein CVT95_03980 [Bacteroidetes bacterium HGW-Bacteroidetes-12]